MRAIALTICVTVLVACQPAAPRYESRYTPPAPSIVPSPPAPLGPGASFIDDFERADTSAGLGEGWDLRGQYVNSYPLPPATDGFIRGGRYTSRGDGVVIAAREFKGEVVRIGGRGKWERVGSGPETTPVLGISPDDHLMSNMVHFAISRNWWSLSVRRKDGAIRRVAGGDFWPPLEFDREYSFEISLVDSDHVLVKVPGGEKAVRVGLRGLTGNRAFWQLYFDKHQAPAGTIFGFDSVWIAEKGQPLAPVANEGSP